MQLVCSIGVDSLGKAKSIAILVQNSALLEAALFYKQVCLE